MGSAVLIAHKQQLGGKTKSTVQPKHAEQRKRTQSKLDTTPGARGHYSATDAKVMATDNQNVRQKSVPARIRKQAILGGSNRIFRQISDRHCHRPSVSS